MNPVIISVKTLHVCCFTITVVYQMLIHIENVCFKEFLIYSYFKATDKADVTLPANRVVVHTMLVMHILNT